MSVTANRALQFLPLKILLDYLLNGDDSTLALERTSGTRRAFSAQFFDSFLTPYLSGQVITVSVHVVFEFIFLYFCSTDPLDKSFWPRASSNRTAPQWTPTIRHGNIRPGKYQELHVTSAVPDAIIS